VQPPLHQLLQRLARVALHRTNLGTGEHTAGGRVVVGVVWDCSRQPRPPLPRIKLSSHLRESLHKAQLAARDGQLHAVRLQG
jgi:hypothetical protein